MLVIVIVALIGSVGWLVHKDYHKVATAPAYKTTTPAATKSAPVPEGYQIYKDTTSEFSLAYPKTWGQLAAAVSSSQVEYPTGAEVTPQVNITIGTDGSTLSPPFELYTTYSNPNQYQFSTYKYGPFISPVKSGDTYTWKVADDNGEPSNPPVGSVYKVNSYTNPQGAIIYEFPNGTADSGTPISTYVFFNSKGYAVTLNMPLLVANSDADIATYNTLMKTVTDTVALQ